MAQDKLPVKTEFITAKTPARLGDIVSDALRQPAAAQAVPALLAEMDANGEGRALREVLGREERRMEGLSEGVEGLTVERPGHDEVRL